MVIEYSIDQDDFLTYQLYTASKSARIKKRRQRGQILSSIIYGFLGILFLFQYNYAAGFSFLGLAVLWYFIYPIWERRYYIKHYKGFIKENKSVQPGATTTIELTNEFIFAKDSASESKFLASELEEINEIPTTIFIKLRSGPSIVLPKNKIRNNDELIKRLKELAAYLNISYNVSLDWEWK